jgi:soluble lytic murein transglycosylase
MKVSRRSKWWLILLFLLAGLVTSYERWRSWREASQDKVILAAAARYGVDPALIKAIVWRESWFNPAARGRAGEIGLMQVGKDAANEWAQAERVAPFAQSHLFDPGTNTLAGTWYLRRMLRRYPRTDNPLPYALAAYNAGATHVTRWTKDSGATNSTAFVQRIDFPSTKKYVLTVMEQQRNYASRSGSVNGNRVF